MKTHRYWIGLLALCSALASAAWAAGPKEGMPAPRAVVKTLDGARIDTTELKGRVVILTFWATWCAYCRQELDDLTAYYREHQKDGLEVLAISVDAADNATQVRERARSYPFPVALHADADASGYGRIWHMPMTFAIDRHGMLIRENWGSSPAVTRVQLEETVTPLLHMSAK